MLTEKGIELRRGMGRGTVKDDNPEGIRFSGQEFLKMGADLLVSLTLMNGVHAFSSGIFKTPKQRIPGIRQPRRVHTQLGALCDITVAHVWAPMEIGTVEEDQPGGFRRLTHIGVWDIVTG